MKKFYIGFGAIMTVSANDREEANHIFYDKIYGVVANPDMSINYAEVNYIEEVEEEEN